MNFLHKIQLGMPQVIKQVSLLRKLGEDYAIVLSPESMCDCSSFIGKEKKKDNDPDYISGTKIKLERKGWSKNKIERYISDLRKIDKNQSEESRWMELISFLRNERDIHKLGILYHWFTGTFETEEIEIHEIIKIEFSKFAINHLKELEENDLLWIYKDFNNSVKKDFY